VATVKTPPARLPRPRPAQRFCLPSSFDGPSNLPPNRGRRCCRLPIPPIPGSACWPPHRATVPFNSKPIQDLFFKRDRHIKPFQSPHRVSIGSQSRPNCPGETRKARYTAGIPKNGVKPRCASPATGNNPKASPPHQTAAPPVRPREKIGIKIRQRTAPSPESGDPKVPCQTRSLATASTRPNKSNKLPERVTPRTARRAFPFSHSNPTAPTEKSPLTGSAVCIPITSRTSKAFAVSMVQGVGTGPRLKIKIRRPWRRRGFPSRSGRVARARHRPARRAVTGVM
jgi:hypothetical protein